MIDITTSTHLRGRLKTAYPKDIDTMLFCLVFQQGIEAVDGNVLQCLCKMVVLNHVACGKRFKTDSVVVSDKSVGDLMEKIIPLITNSLMRSCKSEPCLLPVLRAFGFLGKGTLQTLDFLDGAFQVFVVLYLRTVRKNGERLDAQIYPDSFVFANWLRRSINLVYLNEYGNIVFTSGCPCDNGCLDKTLKLSMEASLNSLSELGDIDPAFIEFHPRVLRYGKTLLACLFGFEIREAFLLTEELDESGIQISECGLQRKRVDLGKPMIFLRLLHFGQICLNVKSGKISLVFLISLDFLVESIVIDKPTTSEVLSQKHFLLLVRVQPIFVCSIFHTTKIIIILETAKEKSKRLVTIHPPRLKTSGISCQDY